jgi:hypothetical protein
MERRLDWGQAPDVLCFVGRTQELETLREWVQDERCRLVALLGIGGVGKTALAARLTEDIAPAFERLYRRTLRDAIPFSEWLAGAIGVLSDQRVLPPEGEAARLTLLQLSRERAGLLVLDNFERVIESGQREGRYRAGYAGYGRLLQAVGEGRHRICLVLTSREAPPELAVLGGAVRTLELGGLSVADGQGLFGRQAPGGQRDGLGDTGRPVRGNSLALKVVGERIREVFGSDLGTWPP